MAKGKRTKALKKAEAIDPQIVGPVKPSSGSQVVTSQYSGPLPPPELMKQYNELHPDFADRIIGSWEKETAHRHHLETLSVQSEIANEKAVSGDVERGQWLAFWLALGFLGVGGFLTYHDKQIAGVIFGSSGFLGIVLSFLKTAFKSRENSQGNSMASPDE